jgi:hypothetical protein
MQSVKALLGNMLDALLPNRAAPVLGRVIKAYEGPGKNRYAVDVQVVTAGTLEDTEQVIAEVPISPLWTGKKEKGLYAIPPADTLVIVAYLHWNTAYPYVSGIWSDEYEAGEFKKEQLVITDGDKISITVDATEKSILIKNDTIEVLLKGNKLAIKNGSKNLFTLLDTHLQNIISMKTSGSPTQHILSPDSIQKVTQDKMDLAALLEE